MVEVNNLSSESIDELFFKKIVKFVLKKENKEGGISIALVEPEEIRRLNKDYRKKDSVTDVLSFANKNDIIEIKGRKEDFIGEIVLCPKKIRENSKEFDVDFTGELYWALVHGVLHLLGYAHEDSKNAEEMRGKEKHYLNFFNK